MMGVTMEAYINLAILGFIPHMLDIMLRLVQSDILALLIFASGLMVPI